LLEPVAHDALQTEAGGDLASIQIWTGELMERNGKLSEALENYHKSVPFLVAVSSVLPWDQYHASRVATMHLKAGAVLADMGRPDEAAAEYSRALEITRPLVSAKPRNPLPWYVIADACSGLGKLAQAAAESPALNRAEQKQHWIEAQNWYQQAVLAWQQVFNPGVIALAEFRAGDPQQALRALAFCNSRLLRLTH
jgi:tetratricopeptide (TPR) repeat protein